MQSKLKDVISGLGIITISVVTYVALLQTEIRRERNQDELQTARAVLGMEDLRILRELQEACGKDCKAEVNFVPPSDNGT